jgi:hypothetical protein
MSPSATVDQRCVALTHANGIRRNRRHLKERLKALGPPGANALATVLSEAPSWLRSVYVWQLVQWVPRVGDAKAAKMLKGCDIDPWRKVGKLTDRQRDALAMALRRHAVSPGLPQVQARAVRKGGCRECGVHLRVPNEAMLCGFCEEERAA